MDEKYWGDKGVEVLRILKGNAVNKAALVLIIGGVSSLTGWFDKAVQVAIGARWADVPEYVGWVLTALGIALLLLNLYLNDWRLRPSSKKDEALMKELRGHFTIGQLDFLKKESFYHRWHRSRIDPVNEVADDFDNAHKEFVDKKLNKLLEAVKTLSKDFSNQEDMAFSEGSEMQLRSLRTVPDQQGLTTATKTKIESLRATSRALASAYEELERAARQRLPDA